MNPVLMIAFNNVDLTRKAIESLKNQDIPVKLFVVNNGSTDGTREYLDSIRNESCEVFHGKENDYPLKVANRLARLIFHEGEEYILGVPNDATFPPNLYSELLRFPYGFVSAGMACPEANPPRKTATMLHHDCHFSVMLTRKWAYDAVVSAYGNFFDEHYFHYASDVDMKQRWKRIGIQGCQTDIQCFHWGSASWRHPSVPEETRKSILKQADIDRETYFKKWGERL